MQKRWLLFSAAALIVIVFTAFLVLNIKKSKAVLSIDQSKGSSVSSLLAQAKSLEMAGSFLEAKGVYQKLVNDFSNSGEIMNWQKKVESLNIKLLFSPAMTANSILYEIKSGDTLTKIAKEYKTTTDLIIKSNNLIDDKILPGRKMKVWTAPFSIVVDKSQNTLILKTDEEIIKTYIVSTGVNNSTPTGDLKIVNKLKNPSWYKAGAIVPPDSQENILGSRWLGFDSPGYGIHGTTDPQSLGRQATKGCVRMSNADVEELYTIVPVGTEVTIID